MAKHNLHNKVNAAFSAYYGMGFLLGGIILVVATVVMLVKWLMGDSEHSGLKLAILLVVGLVMGGIGYSLLRVADEEMEN
jgi:drug/metabolite transporter (DMT)-like permease